MQHQAIIGPRVNGTFGELLQGYIYDETQESYNHFLFSVPIHEKWSFASAGPRIKDSDSKDNFGKRSLCISMLNLMEKRFNIDLTPWNIDISSNIEHGKGMSSSTADIFALGKLIQKISDTKISDEDIRSCARAIEYGDEVLSHGISLCEQREHKLIELYKTSMKLTIVGIDVGNHVKTTDIHEKIQENKSDSNTYHKLRDRLANALRASDYKTVGEISTESGAMFLKYNPYDEWDQVRNLCERNKGLGIILAHSGSVIGILLSQHSDEFDNQKQSIISEFKQMNHKPQVYRIIE